MRKLIPCLLLTLLFVFIAFAPAQADGVIDQVQQNLDDSGLVTNVDTIAGNVITFVRSLAALAAVVFLVWAGIIFWVNGRDARAMAEAKTQLVVFVVALFLIMGSEQIVGALFSLFGWQVSF